MTSPTRVRALVLADTHTGANRVDELVERLEPHLERADVILHAGDVTDASVLDALGSFATVHAVRGNNDHGIVLPDRRIVELGGCQVAMVHDSGPSSGRAARLRGWFPDADVVVFGHSHLPWHVIDVRADGHVQHHVNPGSPTQRRQAPRCTVAWLRVGDGRVVDVTHEPVGSAIVT
jgi:putative phosphoesterase